MGPYDNRYLPSCNVGNMGGCPIEMWGGPDRQDIQRGETIVAVRTFALVGTMGHGGSICLRKPGLISACLSEPQLGKKTNFNMEGPF